MNWFGCGFTAFSRRISPVRVTGTLAVPVLLSLAVLGGCGGERPAATGEESAKGGMERMEPARKRAPVRGTLKPRTPGGKAEIETTATDSAGETTSTIADSAETSSLETAVETTATDIAVVRSSEAGDVEVEVTLKFWETGAGVGGVEVASAGWPLVGEEKPTDDNGRVMFRLAKDAADVTTAAVVVGGGWIPVDRGGASVTALKGKGQTAAIRIPGGEGIRRAAVEVDAGVPVTVWVPQSGDESVPGEFVTVRRVGDLTDEGATVQTDPVKGTAFFQVAGPAGDFEVFLGNVEAGATPRAVKTFSAPPGSGPINIEVH